MKKIALLAPYFVVALFPILTQTLGHFYQELVFIIKYWFHDLEIISKNGK